MQNVNDVLDEEISIYGDRKTISWYCRKERAFIQDWLNYSVNAGFYLLFRTIFIIIILMFLKIACFLYWESALILIGNTVA